MTLTVLVRNFIARVWKTLVLIRRAKGQEIVVNHTGNLKAWRGEVVDRERGPV